MTTITAAVLEVQAACAHAPDGTRVLDGVSFEVPQGALVAIVGPTGAGKTSLVRALTGEIPLSSGRVLLSGADVTCDPPGRRPIGYVAQDDLLHGQLSLGRTLEYAARLRVPPAADRPQRIGAVLTEMGLDQQVAVRMSRLSVGQRKRANIAAELLARPDLLVLDEPTSSLDPGSEKLVMSTLRRLSGSGRTVLAVTHSMHVARECDLVLFMAGGGRVVFFGTPAEAGRHFGWPDVPDLFLALAGHPGSDAVATAGPASGRRVGPGPVGPVGRIEPRSAPSVRPGPPEAAVPGRRTQLGALIGRYGETILSDRRHSAMLGMQGLVLGALLWTFLGANGLRPAPEGSVAAQGVAALMALCMTWIGAANSAREIVKERPILRKEVGNGLSVGAYMGSKAAVLGAVTVVQAVTLTLIATARQRPPGHGAVLASAPVELVVTMALTGLAAVGAGLLISAVVRTADKAMAVLPILVVTEFVLAGLQPAVRWIPGLLQLRYLAGCYWAVQATGATVSGDASTWWRSTAALGLLAAGPVILASILTSRSMAPGLSRSPVPIARPALLEALAARARTALLLASASMLLVAVAALQMVGPGRHGAGRPAVAAATLAGPDRSGDQTGSTGGHALTGPGGASGPAGAASQSGPAGGDSPAQAGTPSVTAGTATAGTGAAGAVGAGTVTPGAVTPGPVSPGAVTPGAVTAGTVVVTADGGSTVGSGSPEGSGRPARLISVPSAGTAALPGASSGGGAPVPASGQASSSQAPSGRSAGGGTGTAAPGSTGAASPVSTGGGTSGAGTGGTASQATTGSAGPAGNSTPTGGGAAPVPAGSDAAPPAGAATEAPVTTVAVPAGAGGNAATGSSPSSGSSPSGPSSASGSTVETASGGQPSNPLGVLAYAWQAWWFNALSWSGAVR